MKKEVIRLSIIFLSIFFFLGIVSADSCSVKTRNSCGDYIIMGLSSSTNAHGEFPDEGTYSYVLCCDFGGGNTECSGTNKIIGLYSNTNSHAEIPEEDNYEIDVCYDGLSCTSTIEGCNEEYPMEVFSLSDWTNAHIGAYGRYICCHHVECREEVNYCSDYYEEEECEYDACGVADESVEITNPEITCGEGYYCSCELIQEICSPVWEEIKEPECGDNIIDSELGETCDGTSLPYTECSGNVDTCTGGTISCYAPGHEKECSLDISECTGCIGEGYCGDDIINNLYETCDNESLNGKTCEDFGLCGEGLACYSPETENNCTFDTTGCESCGNYPSKIGKCTYDETTEDNCDDGFLTYSWLGIWTWNAENIGISPPCEESYVLDGGLCYYDPNGASDKCVDGGNTVPCPAQIQLPFFGDYSLVIILILVVLIYLFLKSKKRKKTISKKRIKKK